MKANKHLEPCTEPCKMCPSGICAFSLRNTLGCYLDDEVKKVSDEIFANAKAINAIQLAKTLFKENKI